MRRPALRVDSSRWQCKKNRSLVLLVSTYPIFNLLLLSCCH